MITIPLTKLIFIDIETVGVSKDYDSCTIESPLIAQQFVNYFDWFLKKFPEDLELLTKKDLHTLKSYNLIFNKRAALVAEFNKIVCVSLAFVLEDGSTRKVSFYNDNEKELLLEVNKTFNRCAKLDFHLCGHNIKNFDIPVLAKRMIVNGILPSTLLPGHDTKPWDMKVIDTKEVWQYGAFGSIGSLDLLCANIGIESPKNGDVYGENVHNKYWEGNNLEKIAEYCGQDVDVLIKIVKYLKELK